MDFSKHIGKTVKNRRGHQVRIAAHIPDAKPGYEIAVVDNHGTVYHVDPQGNFDKPGRTDGLDLMPPTTTVRMRAYRAGSGTVTGMPEALWPECQKYVARGNCSWVSEPFDVEIEA